MRQPCRQLCSGRQLCLAVVTILCASAPAFAQRHHHGHHHGGWYGPGWGYSGGVFGFGRVGPFFPYSYNYGYSSIAGFGGLNYYNGPVGGFGVYGGPVGYTSFGYPNYGYMPMAPLMVQTRPIYIGGDPADNPVIQEWMPDKFKGQNGNANAAPAQPPQRSVKVFVKPTNPEQKRKSIRYQAQADEWFVKANYLQAFARYKQAYSAAPDRPEPRFRMAVTLAAMQEYGPAVDELKKLGRLDPAWPEHGDRLDDLFGADHNISKNILLEKVAGWVREDVRDPDRLYLMGVLLHFNEDADKAKTFFETADLVTSGAADYVQVYLTPAAQHAGAAPRPEPPPAARAKEEEDDDEAPIPRPQAQPAPPKPAADRPTRELAGPRLLDPGVPVGAAPDGR
jgi:hypothetical protein